MKEEKNEVIEENKKGISIKRTMLWGGVLLILFLVVNHLLDSAKEDIMIESEFVLPPLEPWPDDPDLFVYVVAHRTFEETLEDATDVVIAQYVGSRPFGDEDGLTEFEFVVLDRVLGDAADTIFIYASNNVGFEVIGDGIRIAHLPREITFNSGTEYLLPLEQDSWGVYANIHDDGFRFLESIVIDLDDLSNSTMYNEAIAAHSESLDFDGSISRRDVISRVERLTRNNPPAPDFIRSEEIEDIIHGSPYVLVVEVGEPIRLNENTNSPWHSTDLYEVTVVESLKGYPEANEEAVVLFFADTVFPSERHIVVVRPIEAGATDWFNFTSRNSLFSMDQLDDIRAIIDNE